MVEKKDLSFDEVLVEMRTLKRAILCLADKRIVNRLLSYLKPINIKDVCIQSSHIGNDATLKAIIRYDELGDEIESKIISYNEYKALAEEMLREMVKVKTVPEMIVIYRDKVHLKWQTIADAEHYTKRQVYRIYYKQKEQENDGFF